MLNKEVIILAGGFGTRLKEVINNVPKCLAPINEKPFLFYQLEFLKKQGVRRFIFSLGYKSQMVVDYIEACHSDIEVLFSIESDPLGTGGAIKKALQLAKSEYILIVNGDTFFNINLDKFFNNAIESKNPFTIALLKIKQNERYGYVDVDEKFKIIKFHEKKKSKDVLVNSGFYIINKSKLNFSNYKESFSLEKDFFEKVTNEDCLFSILENENFIDIGIPEDYILAQTFFKSLK